MPASAVGVLSVGQEATEAIAERLGYVVTYKPRDEPGHLVNPEIHAPRRAECTKSKRAGIESTARARRRGAKDGGAGEGDEGALEERIGLGGRNDTTQASERTRRARRLLRREPLEKWAWSHDAYARCGYEA